jgi:maleylpyruvate isomerase
MLKLYGYFRSSASYRVRIALNLKGLDYEQAAVSLLKGEQLSEEYRGRNPQALVPVLEDGDLRQTQSMAICEYLEEVYPDPPLLPKTARERSWVRAIALAIACEIHPLNNLRVLKYLKHSMQQNEEQRNAWYRHWVNDGLTAVEAMLAGRRERGTFCHGDTPGLADAFLVPQIANAMRYECTLDPFPTIRHINDECLKLDAFVRAQPHLQPDAV